MRIPDLFCSVKPNRALRIAIHRAQSWISIAPKNQSDGMRPAYICLPNNTTHKPLDVSNMLQDNISVIPFPVIHLNRIAMLILCFVQ